MKNYASALRATNFTVEGIRIVAAISQDLSLQDSCIPTRNVIIHAVLPRLHANRTRGSRNTKRRLHASARVLIHGRLSIANDSAVCKAETVLPLLPLSTTLATHAHNAAPPPRMQNAITAYLLFAPATLSRGSAWSNARSRGRVFNWINARRLINDSRKYARRDGFGLIKLMTHALFIISYPASLFSSRQHTAVSLVRSVNK